LKIRILNPLIIIDILSILLILVAFFIPSNLLRIILGIPFLIFSPGYVLICAILDKEGMDGIEKAGLSIVTSIALVGLIGFGLNYTASGITLEMILASIGFFVIVVSIIGLVRQSRSWRGLILAPEFRFITPAGLKNLFSNPVISILLVLIVVALGGLGYAAITSKASEKFTEFYILGLYGKAQDYPAEFITENGTVTQVVYDSEIEALPGTLGKVTLGLVNQQQQTASYSVKIKIDNETADFDYSGMIQRELKINDLQPGVKWEGEIGFAPHHTGDKQKVEFILYKDGETVPEDSLQLWIDVSGVP
jgi:uncharacterized membrane protein